MNLVQAVGLVLSAYIFFGVLAYFFFDRKCKKIMGISLVDYMMRSVDASRAVGRPTVEMILMVIVVLIWLPVMIYYFIGGRAAPETDDEFDRIIEEKRMLEESEMRRAEYFEKVRKAKENVRKNSDK